MLRTSALLIGALGSLMRTEANRKKVNRLYILGAGASYALSSGQSQNRTAPLDAQFSNAILEMQACKKPKWVAELATQVEKDYLHHTDFESTGLEELICQQLSDYGFIDAIHPKRSLGKRTRDEFLADIIHLICYRLRTVRAKDETALAAWVKKYFRSDLRAGDRNRIITFNYDTLIDKVLLKEHSPQRLYFDNIFDSESAKPTKGGGKYPILLKLHGSINWRCANTEYAKIFAPAAVTTESKTKTYNTQGCHYVDKMWVSASDCKPTDLNTPLIIPPLPQKPITSVAIFRYLWTYAFEYLHEAKNIVIAGYSLPPTDTLAVSLFSKFKNGSLNNLTIVDPDEKALGKWLRLFRRKGIRAHQVHFYPDFLEFIKSET